MRILIASMALLIMLPRVGLQCLEAWYRQQKMSLFIQEYAGRDMTKIQHRTVMVANKPLIDFDIWFLYLKGKINLIGPKALSFQKAYDLGRGNRKRLQVSPGLISPDQIKHNYGVAHQDENTTAIEFATKANTVRRLQILLIWLTQQIFGTKYQNLPSPDSFELLGVKLTNLTMQSAVTKIMQCLRDRNPELAAAKFAFVNADCVNKYRSDTNYKTTLNNFETVFTDGVGVKIAARVQGVALRDNVNGTDMFPILCQQLNAEKSSVYLLGAKPSTVSKVAKKLNADYPQITVAGYQDGFSYADRPDALRALLNASNAELIFVAMGAPLQERWIEENSHFLKARAVIGVGGLFDFYSEEVSRAPKWLRELSLEWVWRLAVQPKDKAKRYLIGNPLFLFRLLIGEQSKRIDTTEVRHESL